MYLPSSALVYLSAKIWGRASETKGRANLEKVFATLGVGLVLASSIALLQALEHSMLLVAITLCSTLVFYVFWDAPALLIMMMFGGAGLFLRL
jgi:hypothetical protein